HLLFIYICLVLVMRLTNGLTVMIGSLSLTHVTFSQTRMFYFVPKLMSWSDAQMHYLDEMMRVIRQFHNGDVWTGLSRTDSNAPWVWSDQSPSTFMPWAPTQPNNWEGNQNCVIVTPGAELNDLDCKRTLPSVCFTVSPNNRLRFRVLSCISPKTEFDLV
uniref:C-type lectin domain-containing protein n=1 Tax=Sinocyclocheilus anshuiensis TaxID=1608454 RepID=A0A671PIB8_9TELE